MKRRRARAGLNVRATQYICLALCGIFCGLAGAQLALSLNMFSVGMTDGRGYTALAVLIMADSRPILSMLACFMFGISDAVVLVLSGTGYNARSLTCCPMCHRAAGGGAAAADPYDRAARSKDHAWKAVF